MTPFIERSPERDAAIEAVLPLVGTRGWTIEALCEAAGPDSDLLFPGGAAELVEAYVDYADRRMVREAAPIVAEERLSRRVRTLILTRLAQAEGERDAVRRGLAILSLPGNTGAGARSLARTVESIWTAAGDVSADFSWYTKRAILAGVYSATLLFWLNDTEGSRTEAFLDRRLAGVARIGKLRARLGRERAAA